MTPHSDSAGRHVGRSEGDGGSLCEAISDGRTPVKPQRPSWLRRAWSFGERWGRGGKMGRTVQIRVCSTFGGTEQ